MTDIDYKVFENRQSGALHLVISPDLVIPMVGLTVCGMDLKHHGFRFDSMKMSSYWRSKKRCHNCTRAAKR